MKFKHYTPKNVVIQYIPIEEREKKSEINCMRIGYILNTLNSVAIQENVQIGGKVIEIYEGVIYRENFKVSPFKKVIDKIFCFQTEL